LLFFAFIVIFLFYVSRFYHPNSARIMFVGDSIVAGYTDKDWDAPFAFGFRGPLIDMISKSGCRATLVGGSNEPWSGIAGTPRLDKVPDIRATGQDGHRGYGSVSMKWLALRLPWWLIVDDPDLVVIYAGINDLGPSDGMVPYYTRWAFRFSRWSTLVLAPRAKLVIANIAPYATGSASANALNAFIEEEFSGNQIGIVDQYSLFADNSGRTNRSLYSNGLNHPTNEAYRLMAVLWFEAIRPWLASSGYCRGGISNGTEG